jgi:hypothetical protein
MLYENILLQMKRKSVKFIITIILSSQMWHDHGPKVRENRLNVTIHLSVYPELCSELESCSCTKGNRSRT